jgi:hypothetical protein
MKLKGKFYGSVVSPTMLYGLECWAFDRKRKQSIVKMRMLRCSVYFRGVIPPQGKCIPPSQKKYMTLLRKLQIIVM